MSFAPENALEQSLLQAANDPAARPGFYRTLLESSLFVVTEGPPPETSGSRTVGVNETLSLRTIAHRGKSFLPVFSSLERLQRVIDREVGYLSLPAREFFAMTQGSDVILNPGSELGKEFTTEEVARLLDGSIFRMEKIDLPRSSQIMLGQAHEEPTELISALTRYFTANAKVISAYHAHFYDPARSDPPHTLIAIEHAGDWQAIASGASLIARETQVPNPPVDFMEYRAGGKGIDEYFHSQTPFYRRA